MLRPVICKINQVLALHACADTHALEVAVVAFCKLPPVDFFVSELLNVDLRDVGISQQCAQVVTIEVV
jgi:hypothetical protein